MIKTKNVLKIKPSNKKEEDSIVIVIVFYTLKRAITKVATTPIPAGKLAIHSYSLFLFDVAGFNITR